MSVPAPARTVTGKDTQSRRGDSLLQRKPACSESGSRCECPTCREGRLSPHRHRLSLSGGRAAGAEEVPEIVRDVVGSSGRPIDDTTRTLFERRFGHDFSRVRVHTDSRAAQSARAVGATAYTVARHVVFGPGQYDPQTNRGRRLLAHELAHVVQQSRVVASGPPARIDPATSHAENEAQEVARRFAEGHAKLDSRTAPSSAGALQRDLATPPPTTATPSRPELTETQIRTAIAFNRTRYTKEQTRLIQDLVGTEPTGTWTEADVRAVGAIQEEYGLTKDGIVGSRMFRFLSEEMRREGLPTDNAHCLTSFFVLGFPTSFNAVAPGQHRLEGHFRVQAQFPARCGCADFQYRQFIRGHFNLRRAGVTHDLTGIFNQLPAGRLTADFREDGDTSDVPVNYGHRNQPADNDPEDHYIDDTGADDQAHGCRYRNEDFPGANLNTQSGDEYDAEIAFRGEIQRRGTAVRTLHWTPVRGRFRVP